MPKAKTCLKTPGMPKAGECRKTLEFTRMEVHLIYGFRAEPKSGWDKWFSDRLLNGKPRRRSGWTPMYRYIGGPSAVLQYDGFVDEQDKVLADLLPPDKWKKSKQEPSRVIPVEISRTATIRRDGVGAITLTLASNVDRDTPYGIRDLLAMMLIAPRTQCGITTDKDYDHDNEMAHFAEDMALPDVVTSKMGAALKRGMTENLQSFSSAFKLYLQSTAELIVHTARRLKWPVDKELELKELNRSAINREKAETPGKKSRPVRILDTQIPYMYVFASAPYGLYKEAFLEESGDFKKKRLARKDYTNEIAAILGRWLIPENVHFASTDYWEAQGRTKDGVFLNQYMNSSVFTTFSGMVAFSLYPDQSTAPGSETLKCKLMGMPLEPTHQSILRCLEFSRTRWHHVIALNRDLDELIGLIGKSTSTCNVLPLQNKLVGLRSQAAIHFEDPLAYSWDATVGSEIAKFLHTSIIERLEESTIKKLNMLDRLIDDRVDILKLRQFSNLMKEQ